MTGRNSAATERALKRVANGETPYSAAKAEGIALSTIYRALERQKNKGRKPMSDRDNKKYTLWWVSGDNQSSLFGGNYASQEAAEAAIPTVESEFRAQCNEDFPWDEDSTWSIEPPDEND
jgi:hypothetical protein